MIEAITGSQVLRLDPQNGHYQIDGREIYPEVKRVGEYEWIVGLGDHRLVVFVHEIDRLNKQVRLSVNGKHMVVQIRSRVEQLLEELGLEEVMHHKAESVKAPMPGLIHSVKVAKGDTVEEGDPLLILEAMKMENIIKSPGDGVVAEVHVSENDSVEKSELLISFE